jgi:hypothetical protein
VDLKGGEGRAVVICRSDQTISGGREGSGVEWMMDSGIRHASEFGRHGRFDVMEKWNRL